MAKSSKPSQRRRTQETGDLVVVKVRIPRVLVGKIDNAFGEGQRSAAIRDLLADRLLPHPALPTIQRLARLSVRIGQWLEDNDWHFSRRCGDSAAISSLPKEQIGEDLRSFRAEIGELNRLMATELLDRAGYRRVQP